MQYRPKRDNKNAYRFCALFIVMAAVCVAAEVTGIGIKLVDQTLIVVFLTCALYVYIRFALSDFVYTVSDDGYLEVIKITAKIPKTLASVKMSSSDIIVREEKDMSAYSFVKRKERFNLTMFAKNCRWYIFELNGVKQALILEGDDDFFDFLQRRIDRS